MDNNQVSKLSFFAKVFNALQRRHFFDWMSDKMYLKICFRLNIGRKLNLKNPIGYNDKLQWLKLYDRNPYYIELVDKYYVKNIVSEKIGKEYLIDNIGIWDSFDEIDFSKLPDKFVLKCTHDSGGVVICDNKKNFDIEKARKKINKCLKRSYYKTNREWPYKMVERKIIAEKYIVDESGTELKDYKFFCFNGKVKYMYIASDRNNDVKFDFYDANFNHLDIINGHENSKFEFKKPDNFSKMIEIAEILSKGLNHIRVDLYNVNGKIYFGEYTLFHMSGLTKFEPVKWDYIFGNELNLDAYKKNKA